MLLRLSIAAAASATMVTSALAWDGARAFHLRPDNSSDLSLTMTLLHAEGTIDLGGFVDTTELGVGVVTPSYHHNFDLGGNSAAFLIGLPIGGLSFATAGGAIDVDTGIAQGDMFIGGTMGLVGMPSLTPAEYFQYVPGFQLSAEAKLFLPTGDYDPDRIVNLGLNRWTLEASLPITYVLGAAMLDPQLMTFELRPVVVVFGDNDDPFGPASTLSQAPIFGLEGHVTRNFGSSLWAALDGYYETGGETSYDGVAQDDAIETLSLGATLGLVLSPQVAVRLSYRGLVYSNVEDSAAHALQVTSAFLF
jgi:hypothetical protein